jgi:hypothetical protein
LEFDYAVSKARRWKCRKLVRDKQMLPWPLRRSKNLVHVKGLSSWSSPSQYGFRVILCMYHSNYWLLCFCSKVLTPKNYRISLSQ